MLSLEMMNKYTLQSWVEQGGALNQTKRVIAYVDGYNLYYGTVAAYGKRLLWIDLPNLAACFLRADQRLAATKFFTSRISRPPESVRRQSNYIDAVRARGVQVVEGRHGGEPEICRCGAKYATSKEKMTDVNIALAIVEDALDDRFDTAFLITADADQVPTIEFVRRRFTEKRFVVLFPPQRHSSHLKKTADVALQINDNHLRRSQLPTEVVVSPNVTLRRPALWQ